MAVIALMITTTAQATIVTTVTPNTGGINLLSGTATPAQTVLTNFDAVTIGSQPSGSPSATGTIPGGGVASSRQCKPVRLPRRG